VSKILKPSLVDAVMFIVLMLPIFTVAFWTFMHYNNSTHLVDVFVSSNVDLILIHFLYGYFVLIICWVMFRDCLKISLGKKVFKVIVIDKRTGKEAGCVLKLMRNVSLLIFFTVDILLKVTTPESRFGDMLTNTHLQIKGEFN